MHIEQTEFKCGKFGHTSVSLCHGEAVSLACCTLSLGCSVMAVCRGSNIVLRLAVAVGKRLQMFVWRTTMTSRKESLTETVFDGPDGFLALEVRPLLCAVLSDFLACVWGYGNMCVVLRHWAGSPP